MVELTDELKKQIEDIEKKIDSEKTDIDSLYQKLGKYTYEVNTPDRDSLIGEVYGKLNSAYENINNYNVEILDIKGFRVCHTCGMQVDKELMYCGNCGTKMKTDIEAVTDRKVCGKCGAVMDKDKKFCTRCGWKLDDLPETAPVQTEVQTENICPSCGKILKPSASFCSGCGIKLK